jgi:hypothetical protein
MCWWSIEHDRNVSSSHSLKSIFNRRFSLLHNNNIHSFHLNVLKSHFDIGTSYMHVAGPVVGYTYNTLLDWKTKPIALILSLILPINLSRNFNWSSCAARHKTGNRFIVATNSTGRALGVRIVTNSRRPSSLRNKVQNVFPRYFLPLRGRWAEREGVELRLANTKIPEKKLDRRRVTSYN